MNMQIASGAPCMLFVQWARPFPAAGTWKRTGYFFAAEASFGMER